MNKAGLFTGIALLAGLGVGYLLGSNTSTESERTARQDQPVYEPPPVERDPDQPRTRLTEALDDMAVPKFALGKGTITGTVTTADGKPLRGVLIRARQRWRGSGRPYQRGQGAPPDRTLEEAVRRAVEYHHRQRGTRRDATTAADGTYTLEGLLESERYNVGAYLEDHEIRVKQGQESHDVAPGVTVDFVAKVLARLRVDVVMPDGSQPERVNLRFRQKNRSESSQWTAEYPTVGIPPGTYNLTATLDGDSDYAAEPVAVEIFADKPNAPVTIHMRSQPGIRATVKLPDGANVQYMQVYAVKMRPNEPPPIDRLREGKRGSRRRGGYAFRDLAQGQYLVAVTLGNDAVIASRAVEVTDHMARCDFDIKEFNPELFVVVRVYGPDGKPVTGVKFGTAFRMQNSSSSGGGYAIEFADRYLVPHHKGDEPGGTHYVTAGTDKYGSKEVGYDKEKTRELEIRFGEPAKLKVTVTGHAGGDAEGKLSMRLTRKGAQRGSNPYSQDGKVPASGTVTIGPAEAGEYELVMFVQVDAHSRLRASATPIVLRAGPNEATVAAPRLHKLTIVLPEETKGQVQIQPDPRGDEWFLASRNVNKTGHVMFDNLVSGRYKVSAGGEEMVIELRATQTVTFQAQLINAMRVTVTDPTGAFAEAGLVNGDLVIGVDGTEFKNRNHMWGLLTMAGGKDRATLNILRGGRRIDVAVNIKSLRGGGRLDGTTR